MTMVEQIKLTMPPAISKCAFTLEPFHSWKIQPKTVAVSPDFQKWQPTLVES